MALPESVRYERAGDVAIVTVDRPERKNAIDRATAVGLRRAVDRFEDDDVAAMVLAGAGGTFSAGADLQAMDLEDDDGGWLGISRLQVEKPTIAAVEGHCVAGGLELALWCDLRVAAESAEFGCLERRYGVPLVDGGTQRLPRIVGLGRALDLILSGRTIDAETALDWGLVTRQTPDGEALDEAIDLGRSIAAFPQPTLRRDRRAVYEGLGEPLDRALTIEAWHGSQVLDVAEAGAAAFRDQREQ